MKPAHLFRVGMLTALLALLGWPLAAQNTPAPNRPARDSLTLQDFLGLVRQNHPLARQADLLPEQARGEIRMARGAFDPVVSGQLDFKEYDGSTYYSYRDIGLKIPVWWAGTLSAGFEETDGRYFSNDRRTPTDGLAYAGISIPVLRGLLLDERRATLRQARLLRDLNAAAQVAAINKLLFSAAKAYWDWVQADLQARLLTEGLALAEFRRQGIIDRYDNGDAAPIDTVEAWAEVLRRRASLAEATLNIQNARLQAENFLWTPDDAPLEIPETLRPVTGTWVDASIPPALAPDTLLAFALTNHPDLRKLQAKQAQLDIDLTLARQGVLPVLDLEYKPILWPNRSGNTGVDAVQPLYRNNYKYGINFYIPLFLRKERGKLLLTNLKVRENQLDIQQTRRDIETGLRQSINNLRGWSGLVRTQTSNAAALTTLLEGENEMFRQGESSLFLVNQRERALLDARLKLVEYQTKFAKSQIELQFAAGQPLDLPYLR